MGGALYLALVPWVAFDVLVRVNSLGVVWGSAVALAASLGVLAFHRSPSSLELFSASVFGVALISWLVAGSGNSVAPYSRSLTAFALGSFALYSAIRRPFTDHYTSFYVPASVARSKAFHRVNVVLSLCWGACFLLIGTSHAIGTALNQKIGGSIFHWLVPLLLIVAVVAVNHQIWNANVDEDRSVSIGELI